MWENGGEPPSAYDRFISLFRGVFNHTLECKEAGEQLLVMKQGRRRVAEHALEFFMLAVENG